MSNEMIENVARAIFDRMPKSNLNDGQDWNKIDFILKVGYRELARAAIKAMREPTDQQRNHYFNLKRESGSTEAYSTFEDGTWEMMIDACLKDE